MNNRVQSGQIALIVLLIMVVVLTIGLAVASRSVTDISISQDEKESLRAFSAAEAGIEEYLKEGATISVGEHSVNVGSLQAMVTITETGEGETQVKEIGETMTVFLTGADNLISNLIVHWTGTTSVEFIIYASDYTFSRFAYNANGETLGNDFTEAVISSEPGFDNQATIPIDVDGFGVDDLLVRIRPLTSQSTIRIYSDVGGLSSQGYDIISKSEAEGEKVGAVEVKKNLPSLLPIFDYVLFSGSSITKT